jgi:hypothetical protein
MEKDRFLFAKSFLRVLLLLHLLCASAKRLARVGECSLVVRTHSAMEAQADAPAVGRFVGASHRMADMLAQHRNETGVRPLPSMRRMLCAPKQRQHHEKALCAQQQMEDAARGSRISASVSQGEIARAAASHRTQCESQGEKKQNNRNAIAITLRFPSPSSKRSTDILFIHTA